MLQDVVDTQVKAAIEAERAMLPQTVAESLDSAQTEREERLRELIDIRLEYARNTDNTAKQIELRRTRKQLYLTLAQAVEVVKICTPETSTKLNALTHTHAMSQVTNTVLAAFRSLGGYQPFLLGNQPLDEEYHVFRHAQSTLAGQGPARARTPTKPSLRQVMVFLGTSTTTLTAAMSTSTASVLHEATNIIPCVVPEQPELAITVRLFLWMYISMSFVFASVATVVYHWETISQLICKITESTIDALHAYLKRKADAGKRGLEAKSPCSISIHEEDPTVKKIQNQTSLVRDPDSAATTAHRASLFLALGKALDDIVDRFPYDDEDMARLTHSHGMARLLDRAITALNNIMVDSYDAWSDELDDTRNDLEKALGSLDSQGCSVPDAISQSELLRLRVQVIEIFKKGFEDEGKPVRLGVGL
ncbi:hypothetical protein LTS10_005134 [Elasticomyces elasticus]|nr:hypothetical protein LTS10_005134 [Elasticomyces elasticus]